MFLGQNLLQFDSASGFLFIALVLISLGSAASVWLKKYSPELAIMKISFPELWLKLSEADLVNGPVPVEAESESPWYIGVLMAFFGWLSAVFLIGFIAVGFSSILDSFVACIAIGSALIVMAYFLLKAGKKEFLEYFALSISLVGQALITYGIFDSNYDNSVAFWLIAAVIQMVLAVVMPSDIHRILSSSFSSVAFSFALYLGGAQWLVNASLMLIICWLWLHEFRYLKVLSKVRCVGYGLVITLVAFKGFHVFETGQFLWGYRSGIDIWVPLWIGQMLTGLVFLYAVWHLVNATIVKSNAGFIDCSLKHRWFTCCSFLSGSGYSSSDSDSVTGLFRE
jgi:hypothetical protein